MPDFGRPDWGFAIFAQIFPKKMISHAQLSKLTALREKKFRYKYRQFTVEGEKMVVELLSQRRLKPLQVFATEVFFEKNGPILSKIGERAQLVTEAELKKISALTTPNQALAVCEMPDSPPDCAKNLENGWHFYLDGIQDPGNLGTIWRLADWFGVPNLLCSPTTADAWNPKTVQASMGAFLRVGATEIELDELLKTTPPGLPVLGATMDGRDIFSEKKRFNGGGLLVIGREGAGLSAEILGKLTDRVSIPRDPAGGAESLNAAIAAGILMAVLKSRP